MTGSPGHGGSLAAAEPVMSKSYMLSRGLTVLLLEGTTGVTVGARAQDMAPSSMAAYNLPPKQGWET